MDKESNPEINVTSNKEIALQRVQVLLEESRNRLISLEGSEVPEDQKTAELVRATITVLEETLKLLSPTVH